MRFREPQPILLPEVKPRNRVVLASTVIARPLPRVRFRCTGCGNVAGAGDCFCGYCGNRLSW
jgi:hypothetical protein